MAAANPDGRWIAYMSNETGRSQGTSGRSPRSAPFPISRDIAPDGRLLVIQTSPQPQPTSFNPVTGWLDELMRRVPIGK